MVAPGARREVGVERVGVAVPVGEPEVVRLPVDAAEPAGEVGDPRGAAAVDAGVVAERVQAGRPRFEEGQRRAAGARRAAVALHVEVDRAAFADPDQARLVDRVGRRLAALQGGRAGAQLGAGGAARGRRLEADVGRDQAPARRGLFGYPARGQVGLRAAAVGAADVDADRPVGRGGPGRHRAARGRGAGVEAEPGVVGGREPGRAHAARLRAGPSGPRLRPRVDDDRPPPSDRARRAALARSRRPQVDGPAVEPHAGVRMLGQPDDRPAVGGGDRLTAEMDRLGAGAGRKHGDQREHDQERAPHLSSNHLTGQTFRPGSEPGRKKTLRPGRGPARARGPRRPSAGCGRAASPPAGRRSGGWRGGRTGR